MTQNLWTHAAHFVVATCLLWDHKFDAALSQMRTLIKANNEHMGIQNTDSSGYHETLTQFYLKQIANIFTIHNPQTKLQAVDCVLKSEILDKNFPFLFYDKADLFSTNARQHFLKSNLLSWLPKTLESDSYQLISATEQLHHQFKDVLNDTVTMQNLIAYFGTSVWTDDMIRERFIKFSSLENVGLAKFYFVQNKSTGEVLGQCGFKNINKTRAEAEFGIILHQSIWGSGVGKLCHGLCLGYAFENMGLKRVTFVTDHQNFKMQKFFANHGIQKVAHSQLEALEYETSLLDWPKLKLSLL